MSPRQLYTGFMLLACGLFLLTRWLMPKPAAYLALPWWQRGSLGLAAFVGGAIGGKLGFVLAQVWTGSHAIGWLADGKTLTTGLMGAYLAVELAKLGLGIRSKTGDTFALPLAVALAVGRLGCLFNGCCYGRETALPWGVDFGDGVLRHPTQVYESCFHFVLAIVLLWITYRDALRLQRLKFYLIAYCLFRFATEYLRPEPAWLLGFTFFQWAVSVFAVALALQWYHDLAPRTELLKERPGVAT